MQVLGAINKFEQCVLNISLINICNQESHVGQEMRQKYNQWQGERDETVYNPWLDLHQFTIYLPHPDQEYENITLEAGLTKGYNVEVQPVQNPSQLPYKIPRGAHFVVVLQQQKLASDFKIVATGMFIRPLGVLSLDLIVDSELGEYQSIMIKHPIIREYPEGLEDKLNLFLAGELPSEELPQIVRYVDQAFNQDYRQPSWHNIYLAATGFAGC
ncbi:hypothetical protein Xen7305DRAFT_00004590 [Xenococcus sp. PCC 7305]|uniref:hypothetical protein n=1 Tax=Xenococcus sp. PCC 7305 TaxID=102125 RepID=UPI0002ACA3DF|nr:hypothetical protein [Xenococcus sp. PCC 7305]ELS00758.1 hypothetical protein Xen7305DRAFT_00004590 [Xenococcus sp. PCC 7305]